MLRHYSRAIRFLSQSFTLCAIYPPCGFNTLNKEHIGLTKFRIINNCEYLRRHLWAGRNHVHLLRRWESHRNHLRTFWCKCISLISLIPCNDPAIVHFTFSITFLSHSTSALGWQISQCLSRELHTQALPLTHVTVGLPQMDRVADYQQFIMRLLVAPLAQGQLW